MVRHMGLPVATVFTTHATLLGRYIASSEEGFYDRLTRLNGDAEAARYSVKTQHRLEKVCAQAAHVFTTVSSITGEECAQLLGRAPDIITPNGLNIAQFYAAHQMQNWHAEYKERINQFVMAHFFPSYAFDLNKTMYFFTSGRFEPRNKGFDLCLESMARLNAELKAAALGITVVFFIVTHRPTRSIHPLVLEKRGVLNELRDVCERITQSLGEKLYQHGAAGEKIHLDDQVDVYWRLRYKRTQYALKSSRLPLVVTHVLDDDQTDPVLGQIRHLGLINRAEDPVKVVYHPEFINPVSPLWGIEYEQFVRGCHMGIFPSIYEPWGYTPLECLACGVPAVTSDLAGFGRYATETLIGHEELGLSVLRRRGRSFHDAAADLTQKLLYFCQLRRRDRIALRNAVERSSWEFDWSRLGPAYHKAHDLALERLGAR
jgi:glycogen(starch) synthase